MLRIGGCFQRVRTLHRHFRNLREYVNWLERYDKALRRNLLPSLRNICEEKSLPRHIRKSIAVRRENTTNADFECNVKAKFGTLIELFRKEEEQIPVKDCFACRRMMKPNQVSLIASSDEKVKSIFNPNDLQGLTEIILCKECKGYVRKKQMPLLCYKNGFDYDEVPDELKNLNFVEMSCIKLVRPFMNMVTLRPLTGPQHGTGMHRGYKGTVIHLPSSPSDTVQHVVTKLPSASNLLLHVEGTTKNGIHWTRMCNFDKVLKALRYLKDHNPEYKNIVIGDRADLIVAMRRSGLCIDDNLEASQCSDLDSQEDSSHQDPHRHVLTQFDMHHLTTTAHTTIHPKNTAATEYFSMAQNKGSAVSALDDNMDLKYFPCLFPKGRFGLCHVRGQKVSETKVIRLMLSHRDRRFMDDEFLIYLNNRRDVKTISGSVSFQLRKQISADSLLNRVANGEEVDQLISSMMRNLKNHDKYWQRIRGELQNQILYFGAPTFFLTLNPAESEWGPLRKIYEIRYPNSKGNTTTMCAMDAMIFVKYFIDRIRNIYRNLILRTNGVLGNCIHFWWRIEYQSRGAPHCHGLIWTKGAPMLHDPQVSDAMVEEFIDRYISVRLPDPIVEPELSQVVNRNQVHACTSTCTEKKKIPGTRIRLQNCRFGYPFPAQNKTVIVSDVMRASTTRKLRTYLLRRTAREARVNARVSPIILAWRANMDIQYVGEFRPNVVEYVSAYVGKSESKNTVSMDQFAERITGGSLKKLAFESLRNRQMGMPEIVDKLSGHPLHSASVSSVFIILDENSKQLRILKPSSKIRSGETLTMNNWMDDHYPNRPVQLENSSLFNLIFNMIYRRTSNKNQRKTAEENEEDETAEEDDEESESHPPNLKCPVVEWLAHRGNDTITPESPFFKFPPGTPFKLQKELGYFVVRSKAVLPRFYLPVVSDGDTDGQEDRCRRLLMLFKPWRNESSDLFVRGNTYVTSWNNFLADCGQGVKGDIEKIVANCDDMTESMLCKKATDKPTSPRQDDNVDEFDPISTLPVQQVTETEMEKMMSNLNDGQKTAFDMVMKRLESLDEGDSFDNLFVSGVAGTGKSFLIQTITSAVDRRYSASETAPSVAVAAPTGLAAKNINGFTLHTLLKIEVEQKKTTAIRSLEGTRLQDLKILFRNIRLLIIDEISMVSNVLLWKVHMRCQEITGEITKAFGGLLVVVLGDLLQLPPVRLCSVFEKLSSKHAHSVFNAVVFPYHLWEQHFAYWELLENMRQREDLVYSEFLNRIRLGTHTEDDMDIIKSRLIKGNNVNDSQFATMEEVVSYYCDLFEKDRKALCVFGKTKTVIAVNDCILKKMEQDDSSLKIIQCPAYESESFLPTNRKGKPWLRTGFSFKDILSGKSAKTMRLCTGGSEKPEEVKRAGGLRKTLSLQIGARYMLTRNLDLSIGLVNGLIGCLQDIVYDQSETIMELVILFDGMMETTRIQRVAIHYHVDTKRERIRIRSQYPVVPAFAVTTHKSQGMTLDNVLCDLYDCFSTGQCYVALSRARNLNGLHVVAVHPSSVLVSTKAVNEYNRLRSTVSLPSLSVPPTRLRNVAKPDWSSVFIGEVTEKTSPGSALQVKPKRKPRRVTEKGNEREGTAQKKKVQKEPANRRKKIVRKAITETEKTDTGGTKQRRRQMPRTAKTISRHLFLINRRFDCFFNSLVQVCRMLPTLKNIVTTDHVWLEFQRLLNATGTDSTASLRVKMNIDDDLQHDVAEQYTTLIYRLPSLDSQPLTVGLTRERRCTLCKDNIHRADTVDRIPVIDVYSDELSCASFLDLLNDLVQWKPTEPHTCNLCGGGVQQTPTEIRYLFDFSETQCICVKLPISHGNGDKRNFTINNQPEEFSMGGYNWKIVGATEHIGEQTNSGHYQAYVKDCDRWFIVSDSDPPVTTSGMKKSCQGISTFFIVKR